MPVSSRLDDREAAVMESRAGIDRVTLPLAPPSVTVIWLEVPVRDLSKDEEVVLPMVTMGISLSRYLDKVIVSEISSSDNVWQENKPVSDHNSWEPLESQSERVAP